MTTAASVPRYSAFAKKHYGDGLLVAERTSSLRSLLARAGADGGRAQRILDPAPNSTELKTWLRKAATVTDVSDIFS